jgi:enediyne biosynthesis protein E4
MCYAPFGNCQIQQLEIRSGSGKMKIIPGLTRQALWYAVVVVVLLSACLGGQETGQPSDEATNVLVQVETVDLNQDADADCEGQFIAHNLGISNGVRMREINTYASNGAGVAVNDLDGDGLLDIVLASTDRESTILWNKGNLQFRAEALDDRFTRAVNIIDVDGDGLLDITFTQRGSESVSFWRNQGSSSDGPRFVRENLEGVDHFAYAMAWADLNGDGTLDLVTGAYDIDLIGSRMAEEAIRQKGGVVVYTQHAGRFTAQQLSQRAETLAVALIDLNGDGKRDVWAANDFALQDGIWFNQGADWEAAKPFRQTSHSTMSIDWGDLKNDGRTVLFTSDMNPPNISPQILAAWLPVTSQLEEKHGPSDPQRMANMLQVQVGQKGWRNEAARWGVEATGWSWSARFGDLDNDGFLDLYVVNGMIADNLFSHLPNGELVEENQAFRSQYGTAFAPVPEWALASTFSGRGMTMADLDNDGDLDIVVNNLRGPAMLFENRLCGGHGLQVELYWPDSANTRAVGAQVELHTSMGVMRRDVRASSGYLSGDPARVHFGFPAGTELQALVIRYPDGAAARIDSPLPQKILKVTR